MLLVVLLLLLHLMLGATTADVTLALQRGS
jgi:hypothetical protein